VEADFLLSHSNNEIKIILLWNTAKLFSEMVIIFSSIVVDIALKVFH